MLRNVVRDDQLRTICGGGGARIKTHIVCTPIIVVILLEAKPHLCGSGQVDNAKVEAAQRPAVPARYRRCANGHSSWFVGTRLEVTNLQSGASTESALAQIDQ